MADWRIDKNPEIAYEPTDWPVGTIAFILAGIIALLVIAPLVLMTVFRGAVSDVDRSSRVEPPPPQLQVDPSEDLARLRAAEEQRLYGYYWIDKDRGVVHIPIDRAMKKLAEQGIDGFPRGQP
jgi:hypothetical protein